MSIHDKIIRNILYALMFLMPIFFLPFTSVVLDYNKQVFLLALSVVAIVAWLVKTVKRGRLVWRRNFANVFVLVFLASYGAATAFSLFKAGSFWGFLNHSSGSFTSMISFVIVYFLATNIFGLSKKIDSEKGNESKIPVRSFSTGKAIQLMVYGITIAGVIGLLQLLGVFIFPWDFAKVASFNTVGTFNSLALLLAVGVILGLTLITNNGSDSPATGSRINRGSKLEYVKGIFVKIAAIFMFVMMVLINFWLAWLVLAVGIVVFIIFSTDKNHGILTGRKVFSLPIIFLILSIIFWQFSFVYTAIPVKVVAPVEVYPTFKASFGVIKGIIQDRLLFGSGPETFAFDWSHYKPESVNLSDLWYVRFNSSTAWWTNILAGGGLVSFLAVGLFIGFLLYKSVRMMISKSVSNLTIGPLEVGIFSTFLALVVSKVFYASNVTLEFYFWILAGLLAAILAKYEIKKFKIVLDKFPRVSVAVSFVLIFIIIAGFALLFLKGQHYIAEIYYKKAYVALDQKKNWDITTDYLLKAAQMNRFQDTYSRDLAKMYLQRATEEMSEVNKKEKDVSEAGPRIQKFVQNAVAFAENATNLSPNDVANWIQKARVYDSIIGYINGADKKSIESWQKAAELEPSNPYIWTQLGVSYLTKASSAYQAKDKEAGDGAAKDAENSFKKAAELKPNYAPAHYQLAVLYEGQGKIKDAIRKLETAGGISKNDYTLAFKLGMLYLKDNQKDKAKTAFALAIKSNPNYSDAKWYLALILESEGDLKNAIKLVEQVYELNSQNEDVRTKLEALKKGQISQTPPGQKPPLGQELEERP